MWTSLRLLVLGLWMVVLALGMRLAGTAGPQWASPSAAQTLQLGGVSPVSQRVTAETASQMAQVPEKPPDTEPEAAVPDVLCFSAQEADAIAIGGSAQSAVDKASLLLSPLELPADTAPQVLIVHTHTSEAYTPEPGWDYTPTEAYRTLDAGRNVVRVGEEVASCLRESGVGVIHDTTVNDSPEYEGAYERSFECISAQLAAHPSIRIVLDIHRDAAEDSEGNALPRLTELDGRDCAQLMLVVGTDEGGLYHPDWQENLAFALKLQALLNRDYPTLCRDLSLRRERYNQQFTPCSLLVEVGAAGNTLPQALEAARCLAQGLAEIIKAGGVSASQ